MAKKLVMDLLDRGNVCSVCKAARNLMEDICKAGRDNWFSTLQQGCEAYSLEHSELQMVIFAATLSLHKIILHENTVHIDMYPMFLMVQKVNKFSYNKEKFRIRVQDNLSKTSKDQIVLLEIV